MIALLFGHPLHQVCELAHAAVLANERLKPCRMLFCLRRLNGSEHVALLRLFHSDLLNAGECLMDVAMLIDGCANLHRHVN